MTYTIAVLQWKTTDDGQRNCPKHVEFYPKNKFEKLAHLVGFIIRSLLSNGIEWKLIGYGKRRKKCCYKQDDLRVFGFSDCVTEINRSLDLILILYPASFIILYNEPTNAQLIDNYHTPTCFDTTVSSSGSS